MISGRAAIGIAVVMMVLSFAVLVPGNSVPATRAVNTGDGLSGGGDLDDDLTLVAVLSTDLAGGVTTSASGLQFLTGEIGFLTCATGQINKYIASGAVECATDSTAAGGSAVVLDLGDDGDDSTDLNKITTSGDDNGIFTEPVADQVFIDLHFNWPGADTSTALVADSVSSVTVAGAERVRFLTTEVRLGTNSLSWGPTLAGTDYSISRIDANTASLNADLRLREQNAGQTAELDFFELNANGGLFLGLTAPDNLTTTQLYVLPSIDGAADSVLTTDGAGSLTWTGKGAGGGGGDGDTVIVLDLGDDGDDSAALTKIITTGDASNAAQEISADELTICFACPWSGGSATSTLAALATTSTASATAAALASDGANCAAGQSASGVDTLGASQGCTDTEEEAQVGTTDVTGNADDDEVLIGSASNAAAWVGMPNCAASSSKLLYNVTSTAFTCGTDAGAGAGGSAITLDLGDDDGDDSTDLNEIATTGGGAIATLDAADKLLLCFSCVWPGGAATSTLSTTSTGAATAASLAANGANCGAGEWARRAWTLSGPLRTAHRTTTLLTTTQRCRTRSPSAMPGRLTRTP